MDNPETQATLGIQDTGQQQTNKTNQYNTEKLIIKPQI